MTGGPVRYWLGGNLVTMADASVPWSVDAMYSLVVEVNTTTRVGTYLNVAGPDLNTLPTLTANQYQIATFRASSLGGIELLEKTVREPAATRPDRVQTRRIHANAAILSPANSAADVDNGAVHLGFSGTAGYAIVPLGNLPIGSTITAIRVIASPKTSAGVGITATLRYWDETASLGSGTPTLGEVQNPPTAYVATTPTATNVGQPAVYTSEVTLTPSAADGAIRRDRAHEVLIEAGASNNRLAGDGLLLRRSRLRSGGLVTTNAFSLASELAVRMAARKPAWVVQAGSLFEPPNSATDGVALFGAPTSLVAIALRQVLTGRSAVLTFGSWVAGQSFTVTVDGASVVYDSTGDADLPATLTDFANAINGDPTVGLLVQATPEDSTGNGANDRLRLVGRNPEDFSIGFSGGVGVTCTADAASAVVALSYALDAALLTTAPVDWFAPPDALHIVQSPMARRVLRVSTGGYLRGHVTLAQLTGVGGDAASTLLTAPTVTWGPAFSET